MKAAGFNVKRYFAKCPFSGSAVCSAVPRPYRVRGMRGHHDHLAKNPQRNSADKTDVIDSMAVLKTDIPRNARIRVHYVNSNPGFAPRTLLKLRMVLILKVDSGSAPVWITLPGN